MYRRRFEEGFWIQRRLGVFLSLVIVSTLLESLLEQDGKDKYDLILQTTSRPCASDVPLAVMRRVNC